MQSLFARGLGATGVALAPAPIAGVVPGSVSLIAALPVLARWNAWNRPFLLTREAFVASFANTAPPEL